MGPGIETEPALRRGGGDGAGASADLCAGLVDRDVDPGLGEQHGRGEAAGAGADDTDTPGHGVVTPGVGTAGVGTAGGVTSRSRGNGMGNSNLSLARQPDLPHLGA